MPPPSPSPARSTGVRTFRWMASVLLGLAAVPRLWAAWCDQGIFWPDEIFQSLEQAHRVVFGYGIVPWEFRTGARSWVLPGLLAGLLRVGTWFGLDSGRGLVLLAKTSMALISLVGIYLSMRFAYRLQGLLAALLAGTFAAFFPASLLLASRCSAETVSATVCMAVVVLATQSGRGRQLAAGALAGLAIYLRYQNGLIAVAMLGVLVWERRFADARAFAASCGVVGVLGGLLDWPTWGAPFYAFKRYLWFNLYKSAKRFGAYPFTYYFKVAWAIAGPAVLVIVGGLLASARRAPGLVAIVLGYVLIHCVVPHKEFRFLVPILPLAFALSGAGIGALLERVRRARLIAAALAISCAAWMGALTTQLTWGKLGFPSDRAARSPWHSGGGINRLLWAVGRRPDLCGVIVTGESFGWIGGYSYLHRDVDIYPELTAGARAAANYLIAPSADAVPRDYRKLDSSREFSLYRRDGRCGPAPEGYRRELP